MGLLFKNLSSDIIASIIALLLIVISIIYFYVKHVFSYWKRRGVKYIEPSFPFGNFTLLLLQKLSVGEVTAKLYDEAKDEPFIGIYGALRPMLFPRDPKLIRNIFVKDFQHFVDRGMYIDEKNDPLSGHLATLSGDRWKHLRGKLTPVFTTGKLKAMFTTLLDCGFTLQRHLDKLAETDGFVEMYELASRYTTDVIASVAFGIEINSIDNPDTEFRKYGRKQFAVGARSGFLAFGLFIYPKLQKILKIKWVPSDVENFILRLVKDTIEYREKNNVSRKDLLQLLIQLRNTGKVESDGIWDTNIVKNESDKGLTFNAAAAQAADFFFTGFQTSATTISFCLFEMAKYPDIQQKAQREIDEVLQRHNNKLTYESVSEMKYLELCIDGEIISKSLALEHNLNHLPETLRKYPPFVSWTRMCTEDYQIPGTNVTVEKGTAVLIPTLAIHRDRKYFKDPMDFIPERFSPENVKPFEEMPYFPFGEGPRNCIGLRLAKMQTKVGLLLMLQKFNYDLWDSNIKELCLSVPAIHLMALGGVKLKVSKRIK